MNAAADAAIWMFNAGKDVGNAGKGIADWMVQAVKDTEETMKDVAQDVSDYLEALFAGGYETTLEVNVVPSTTPGPASNGGGGHGSWGGAGAGAMGQMGFGLNMWGGFVGMHANGLFSVPWDGYPAILHKGERVMTAEENKRYTYNNYFGNVNLNHGLEIEALTESIERRNRRQQSGFGA